MNRIAITVISPFLLCFSSIVHAQVAPESVQIIQATYGAGDAQMDVTQKVQTAIASGQSNFRPDNHFFGKDPASGKGKTLVVTFVQGGVQYQTTAREGEQLSFAKANVDQSNVAPQAPPALAPREQRQLAPDGTLYLIQRTSVKTATGITGFAPGTGLNLVEDHGRTLLVTDGTVKFEVPRGIVTNDLDIAQGASASDQAAQNAVANKIERSNKEAQQAQEEYNARLDQQQQELEARQAAADAAGPHNSGKLDREAYNQSDAIGYPYGNPHHHRIIYTKKTKEK
jgi:hypothetical protein